MSRKQTLDVTFENWNDLICALETDYTISLKDVCMQLKSSRTWINQFVRPNVPALYIGSNNRGDSRKGVNWVELARIKLNNEMTESIWFHREEFSKFLDNCTYSVTKQTKSVPVIYLMTETNQKQYLQKRNDLQSQIETETSIRQKINLLQEQKNCYLDYVKKDKATENLLKNAKSFTKRSEVEPVPVDLKYTDIKADCWYAVHDLKEYGDIDELIYRKFFTDGYIRIELHFPDKDGVIGKKIFYTKDIEYLDGKGSRIIVAESDWLEYAKKNNIITKKHEEMISSNYKELSTKDLIDLETDMEFKIIQAEINKKISIEYHRQLINQQKEIKAELKKREQ